MIDKFMTKINFNGPVLDEYLGRCWIWTDRTRTRMVRQRVGTANLTHRLDIVYGR